mmetsp:Transcript_12904/g.27230  ORF Transcript_12904/g.27230 Transcript_12904/m.27230 type:complete len:476 (+) Transcript_12904:3-1430(+)
MDERGRTPFSLLFDDYAEEVMEALEEDVTPKMVRDRIKKGGELHECWKMLQVLLQAAYKGNVAEDDEGGGTGVSSESKASLSHPSILLGIKEEYANGQRNGSEEKKDSHSSPTTSFSSPVHHVPQTKEVNNLDCYDQQNFSIVHAAAGVWECPAPLAKLVLKCICGKSQYSFVPKGSNSMGEEDSNPDLDDDDDDESDVPPRKSRSDRHRDRNRDKPKPRTIITTTTSSKRKKRRHRHPSTSSQPRLPLRYRGFSTSISSLFLDESIVCGAISCCGLLLSSRTEYLLNERNVKRGLTRRGTKQGGSRAPSRILGVSLVVTIVLVVVSYVVWGFGTQYYYYGEEGSGGDSGNYSNDNGNNNGGRNNDDNNNNYDDDGGNNNNRNNSNNNDDGVEYEYEDDQVANDDAQQQNADDGVQANDDEVQQQADDDVAQDDGEQANDDANQQQQQQQQQQWRNVGWHDPITDSSGNDNLPHF